MATKGNGMEFTVCEGLAYCPDSGTSRAGDLYLPEIKKPRPILLIHGGAWRHMSRVRFARLAQELVQMGYAVFNIDYRLLGEAPYPACEDDCILAARFLLDAPAPELNGLDRNRLLVMGASAGAHLALMTGMKLPSDRIAGIINLSGPTDLTAPEIQDLLERCQFTEEDACAETLRRDASPALISCPHLPPLLTLHSRQDRVVPFPQALRIAERWNHDGGDLQTWFYNGNPNRGHDLWCAEEESPELKPDLKAQVAAFLNTVYPPIPTP